ncbi:MAG: hypothetical protein [Siphoviridae sp. ctpQM7]|nr:MAG: hypothetical protein [Siphoviridae sp. ctpQM7]
MASVLQQRLQNPMMQSAGSTPPPAISVDRPTLEHLRRLNISDDTIANSFARGDERFGGALRNVRLSSGNNPEAITGLLNYHIYGDSQYREDGGNIMDVVEREDRFRERMQDGAFTAGGVSQFTQEGAKGITQFFTDPLVLAAQGGAMAAAEVGDLLLPGAPLQEKLRGSSFEKYSRGAAARTIEASPTYAGIAASLFPPARPFAPLIAGGARVALEAIQGEEDPLLRGVQEGAMFALLGGLKIGPRFLQSYLPGIKNFQTGLKFGALNAVAQNLLDDSEETQSLWDNAENVVAQGLLGGGFGLMAAGMRRGGGPMLQKAEITTEGALPETPPSPPPPSAPPVRPVGIRGAIGRVVDSIMDARKRRVELKKRLPAYQEAIKSGVPEEQVDFIAESNRAEKAAYKTIMDLLEEKDPLKSGADEKYVGGFITDRAATLVKTQGKIGKVIGNLIRRSGDAEVDMVATHATLTEILNDARVTLTRKGGKFIGLHADGLGEGDKALLLDFANDFRYGETPGRARVSKLHDVRYRLFDDVNLAAERKAPISSRMAGMVERLRSAMMKDVSARIPEYAKYEQAYAELNRSVTDIAKWLGLKKSARFIEEMDIKAAEKSRAVFGNASATPRQMIDAVYDLSERYGHASNVNPHRILSFWEYLRKLNKTQQTASLSAGIEEGIVRAAGRSVYSPRVGAGAILQTALQKGTEFLGYDVATQKAAIRVLLDLNQSSPEIVKLMESILDEASTQELLNMEKAKGEPPIIEQGGVVSERKPPKKSEAQMWREELKGLLKQKEEIEQGGRLGGDELRDSDKGRAVGGIMRELENKGAFKYRGGISGGDPAGALSYINEAIEHHRGKPIEDALQNARWKIGGGTFDDIESSTDFSNGYEQGFYPERNIAQIDKIQKMIDEGYQGLRKDEVIDEHGTTLQKMMDDWYEENFSANQKRQATRKKNAEQKEP